MANSATYQADYREANRETLNAQKKVRYAAKQAKLGREVRKSKSERQEDELNAEKVSRAVYQQKYYLKTIKDRQPKPEKEIPEEADIPVDTKKAGEYIAKIDAINARLEKMSLFGIEREELERELNILEYKLENCSK